MRFYLLGFVEKFQRIWELKRWQLKEFVHLISESKTKFIMQILYLVSAGTNMLNESQNKQFVARRRPQDIVQHESTQTNVLE